MIFSLIQRNNKIFFRNKTQVFFSFLAVVIVIGLYVIFLQKLQLDSIEAHIPITSEIKVMVNEWMVSGVISITAVTTTLSVFSLYIKDLETKISADFLSTTLSRISIQFSYCISSLLIGFILTMFAYICCQIFIVVSGGTWLPWHATLQVIGLIILSVLLSSVLNLFIVSFIQSQAAFATANTIVGTLIGFLCGVYVPMGVLPEFVQKFIQFFPVSHTTVLLRQVFMEQSLEKVFPTEEVKTEYMLLYGVQYEIGERIIEPWMSLLFIIGMIMLVGIIAAIIFARKNK